MTPHSHVPQTMRAAVYRRFGGPEVVILEMVPVPKPRPGEVLVRVHATTVSAADRRTRSKDVPRGLAVPTALALGVFRPRKRVLGMDAAGVVVEAGSDVTRFAVGDEVVALLGSRFGGHAEYVAVREDAAIARAPKGLPLEESVALIFGGVTAQAFLGRADIVSGADVLVHGASGAVGTAAVQLAKAAGARVTAVTSARNAPLVASLGADRLINYTESDFTSVPAAYDVVFDAVGDRPLDALVSAVRPGGTVLRVVAELGDLLSAPRRSRRSGATVVASAPAFTADHLSAVVAAAESGALRPVIERTVGLDAIVDAHRHVDTGRKRGSLVVRVAPSTPDAEKESELVRNPASVSVHRAEQVVTAQTEPPSM